MAQDELQRVLDAAGHLPEPTRTIFRLNRLQGQTQAEIARRLGVSVTTVENHVRGALQRLPGRAVADDHAGLGLARAQTS